MFATTIGRIIKFEFTIKQLFNFVLSSYLLFLVIAFLFVGGSRFFDGQTLMLCIGLCLLVLWNLNRTGNEPGFGLAAMVVMLFLLFVFPRTLGYLIAPSAVVFPYGQNIESETINIGLLYVLLGTAALQLGQVLYEKLYPPPSGPKAEVSPSGFSFKMLAILFLVAACIQIYLSQGLAVNPFAVNSRLPSFWANTFVQLLIVTIDVDMVLLVVLVTFLGRKAKNWGDWAFVLVAVAAYLFMTAYLGSRGGSMRVILMLLAISLAKYGNFNIRMDRLALMVLVMAALSWITYPLATKQRIDFAVEHNVHLAKSSIVPPDGVKLNEERQQGGGPPDGVKLNEERQQGGGLLINCFQRVYQRAVNSAHLAYQRVTDTAYLVQIFGRLGVLDYAIASVTQPGDPEAIRKYMTLEYSLKSIVNVLPGTVFQDAEINTSRAVPVIWRGVSPNYVLGSAYYSEFYTVWGVAYLFCGWGGGLVLLTFAGVALSACQRGTARFGGIYFPTLFLFCVPSLVYFSMGLDHTVTTAAIEYLRLVVVLLLLSLLSGSNSAHRIASI